MSDLIAEAEVKAAGFVVSKAAALIGMAVTLFVGIGAVEAYEHAFAFHAGFIDVRGMGVRLADAKADQAKALTVVQAKVQAQEAKAATISTKAETDAIATQAQIQTVTRTLIQKVPIYVTAKDDAACPVPSGAVSVLDAASAGTTSKLPDAPAGADGRGPGIALSDVVRHDATVSGLYHEVADRLTKLQGWVTDQKALSDRAAPP